MIREKHTEDANMLITIYEDDSKCVVSKIQEERTLGES